MDVYDFLNTFTDLSGVIVTIFDCDSDKTVFNSGEAGCFLLSDIEEADLDGYDVESVDLFRDGHDLHLEINISMGDESDE